MTIRIELPNKKLIRLNLIIRNSKSCLGNTQLNCMIEKIIPSEVTHSLMIKITSLLTSKRRTLFKIKMVFTFVLKIQKIKPSRVWEAP